MLSTAYKGNDDCCSIRIYSSGSIDATVNLTYEATNGNPTEALLPNFSEANLKSNNIIISGNGSKP